MCFSIRIEIPFLNIGKKPNILQPHTHASRACENLSKAFSEQLKEYWFYEVIDDNDFRDLLIINDIVHVLQAYGYPEELAMEEAFNIFYTVEL